jgi:toxin ParE1/3/4
MAQYRLSLPAQADIREILAASVDRWGNSGSRRYAALLAAAMRRIASFPSRPNTHGRNELLAGLRSFHIRHVRSGPSTKVGQPVRVLYYRAAEPGLIEIVRVLHERMEPLRHLRATDEG